MADWFREERSSEEVLEWRKGCRRKLWKISSFTWHQGRHWDSNKAEQRERRGSWGVVLQKGWRKLFALVRDDVRVPCRRAFEGLPLGCDDLRFLELLL